MIFIGLIGLAWFVVAPILGVIGFARASAISTELEALRAQLDADRIRPETAPVQAPATSSPSRNESNPSSAPLPEDRTPPAPIAAAAPPATPTPRSPPVRLDLESVITTRWAVWLGAVALLFAGVFLIRYAAEQGLLGPTMRCCAAAALGSALLAGAEWLRRRDLPQAEGAFTPDQAPGALAAGGVAVLFGAAYGAGPFYTLVPQSVGFAGMAAASFLALLAALRFGPLTAAVGIVGAFASPALIATATPSLVGLFAYLAIVTAAAYAVVRRTAWTWLGWTVTIAGALWVLVAASRSHDPALWAAAAFIPVSAFLGLLLPAAALDMAIGRRLAWGQFAIMAAAALCLDAAAPGLAPRLALFTLSPIAIWKGIDDRRLDRLPWLAAFCGLAALWIWNGSNRVDPGLVFRSLDRIDLEREPGTLLGTAFLFAAAYSGIGLFAETRALHPTRWVALVATVPLLSLAACYAMVGRLEADPRWSFVGLILAVALMVTSYRALLRRDAPSAGVHAAGCLAALSFGFAMTLHDQWLSTALALTLPGLAWIESKVELPALRTVAIVIATVTFALLVWWIPYDLLFGQRTIADHAVVTYLVPALAFFAAAHVFRRRTEDRVVAVLEAGGMVSAAVFIAVEIRLWFGAGALAAPLTFDEVVALMLAAAAQAYAYHHIARREGRRTALVARGALGGLAYLVGVSLLVANPMIIDAHAGLSSMLFAYLVPGVFAGLLARQAREPVFRSLLDGYAIAACVLWTSLQVRYAFHPDAMGLFRSQVSEAELWTWSGVWLIDGCAILLLGIALRQRGFRLVGLALVALVCVKVFLVDMAALTGLWRVASFLGLGLGLIGVGAVHRRFVSPREA